MINRKIPATLATQHPDHANTPYWLNDPFISTRDEQQELMLNFQELDVDEYKWDWEGKLVDESIIERLLAENYSYFEDHPLGGEKFLTFRLPNPTVQTEFRLPRAFFTIWSASALANELNFKSPLLFEAILPMTTSADEILAVQIAYDELNQLNHPYYNPSKGKLDYLEIIPLFEDIDTIMNSAEIISSYLDKHRDFFKTEPEYLRPYVARSDPALNAGLVPTVLAIKIALSSYAKLEKIRGIELFPMIGAAALPFRGGINPESVESFVNQYKGIRTTTIQSGFRYDYPLEQAKNAIKKLRSLLSQDSAEIITTEEEGLLRMIVKKFSANYRPVIEAIAEDINLVAKQIPKRRERVQHIGLFGYSRGVGKVKLPRAISFTCALYSLGVPPELIATGRTIKTLSLAEIKIITAYYPNLINDLIHAVKFTNEGNLQRLATNDSGWKQILDDLIAIKKFLSDNAAVKIETDHEHQQITTEIYKSLRSGKEITDLITAAGKIRKSLG